LKLFSKPLTLLSDFYFNLGKLYFRRQATPVRDDPADLDTTTTNESIEQSFFLMLTAASLGHKQARAYLAIMMENGMIPSSEVIRQMTS
jgi:TPR repeat protein